MICSCMYLTALCWYVYALHNLQQRNAGVSYIIKLSVHQTKVMMQEMPLDIISTTAKQLQLVLGLY